MEYRLKRNSDFQKLFRKGNKTFSRSLVVLYLPASATRFGLSVSKKHGNSVKRNRIKRLLREAFYRIRGEISRPLSIVFIPKVQEDYSFQAFANEMQYAFRKANLLKEHEKTAD